MKLADVSCGFNSDSIATTSDGLPVLILDDAGKFEDTSFWFDVQENCPENVDVEVSIKTNEFDLEYGTGMAQLFPIESLVGVTQAVLYVVSETCAGDQTGRALPCRADSAVDFRFYEITVQATDLAGNLDSATCLVFIRPSSSTADDDTDARRRTESTDDALFASFSQSITRFSLATQNVVWNNVVAPSEIPSSNPTVSQLPTLSVYPSVLPSAGTTLSAAPSAGPSANPTLSAAPSISPTTLPTAQPTTKSGKRGSSSSSSSSSSSNKNTSKGGMQTMAAMHNMGKRAL